MHTITAPIFAAYLATLDADAVRAIQALIATDACEGRATNSRRLDRVWGELELDEAFVLAEARLAEVEPRPVQRNRYGEMNWPPDSVPDLTVGFYRHAVSEPMPRSEIVKRAIEVAEKKLGDFAREDFAVRWAPKDRGVTLSTLNGHRGIHVLPSEIQAECTEIRVEMAELR